MHKYDIGDAVNVTAKPSDIFHNFSGTICQIHGEQIEVVDQDDDVWTCDADQVELQD